MSETTLTPVEQRVLGSLLEKQKTVPASYPLTLNGLRTACNQTSSREPVTDHDEQTIEECLRGLKDRELVRFVWAGKGSRALKYHQRLDEQLGLADDERALITVLLLRGPQTPGELRTRTERLHPFADKEAAEACLTRLAERPTPLVRMLERQPGQHDHRWVHLLGPVAGSEPAAITAPAVDRDGILAEGASARDARVLDSYERIAAAYGQAEEQRWAERPFDRWLLERVATTATGPVADVGCGSGGGTALLADAGAEVTGFDVSSAMVETARSLRPDLRFEVADLTRLLRPPTAPAWGAVVAWQALGHLAGSELATAIASMARVLAPGSTLALAVHVGDEVRHVDELFGEPVDLDLVLHDPDQVRAAVTAAGLEVDEWYLRGPIAGDPDTNLYLLARKV